MNNKKIFQDNFCCSAAQLFRCSAVQLLTYTKSSIADLAMSPKSCSKGWNSFKLNSFKEEE